MAPKFGVSLTDYARAVIYNRNMSIINGTGANVKKLFFFISYNESK
jgi:hypothetical protein